MRMRLRYLLLLVGCALSLYVLLILSQRNAGDQRRSTFHKGDKLRSKLVAKEDDTVGDPPVGEERTNDLSDDPQDIEESPPRSKKDHAGGKLPRGKLSELGPRHIPKAGVTCAPRENITFIKVHKTGSSTVQNIFLRYGDKHNLQFVLPPRGHHLGYPNYFETRHMLHNEKNSYNIFCHHTRFSTTISHVMPPNTYYITIVRDPVKVFESAFTYFKMDYRLGMTGDPEALQKFLNDAHTIYKDQANKVHLKNTMLYDLGVPIAEYDSEAAIKTSIKTFQKRYRLVMVAEYFEESLVLLRDLLCWSTEDVVVFKLNTRKDDSIVPLSEDVKSQIRMWNKGDVLLYEHFNRTIQRKIEEYGKERMAQEVALLKRKTDELYARCIESDHADKEHGEFRVWQPFGVHINAFVLKPERKGDKECERMIIPEIQFTKELRKKQYPDLKEPEENLKARKGNSRRRIPPR